MSLLLKRNSGFSRSHFETYSSTPFLPFPTVSHIYPLGGGGGGILPSRRLMGMCRWMGSHFHGGINYNVVAFLLELLEWDRTFSGFGKSEHSGRYRSKNG